MRRLAAATLFAVLIVPVFLPFFARSTNPDAQLPACCRRDGKHHCMMSPAEQQTTDHQFQQAMTACPFRPASTPVAPTAALYPPAVVAFYASVVQHPTVQQQAKINLLVAEARSHQKRGPPTLLES